MCNTLPSIWKTRRFPYPTLDGAGGCFCRFSPRCRVVRYREGDFVRGERFCTPSQATTGTAPTIPPSRDDYTLPRHFRPPRTLPPSRVNSWTVSSRSCAALKRREYGVLKNGNKTTNIWALSRFDDLSWCHNTGISDDNLWITLLRNSSKLKLEMRQENSLN